MFKNIRRGGNDGRIKIAHSTADEGNTTTTLADHTELFIPLKVNTRYSFLLLSFIKEVGGVALKLSWTLPSGSSARGYAHSLTRNVVQIAYGLTTTGTSSANGNTITSYGNFETGATAGNLQFQFALNSAGTEIFINENSILICIEEGGA